MERISPRAKKPVIVQLCPIWFYGYINERGKTLGSILSNTVKSSVGQENTVGPSYPVAKR